MSLYVPIDHSSLASISNAIASLTHGCHPSFSHVLLQLLPKYIFQPRSPYLLYHLGHLHGHPITQNLALALVPVITIASSEDLWRFSLLSPSTCLSSRRNKRSVAKVRQIQDVCQRIATRQTMIFLGRAT
jgi:hypothetical protein